MMAGLYHISSSADAPNHSMCPDDGWCEYNKDPENYQHHEGIPMCIVDLIEPIYIKLSDPLLLSRCAHGKTQSSNESFNKRIWDRCRKEVWVGQPVVEHSVIMAVGQLNDGATALVKVLKKMEIEPGHFMSKLTRIKTVEELHALSGNHLILPFRGKRFSEHCKKVSLIETKKNYFLFCWRVLSCYPSQHGYHNTNN